MKIPLMQYKSVLLQNKSDIYEHTSMHTAMNIAAQDQTCIFNVNSGIIFDRMRLYERLE